MLKRPISLGTVSSPPPTSTWSNNLPCQTSIFGRVVSVSQFRYASRVLLKSPGFALTSILTLALGIGITSAIFSVVYGVLLKPTPYAHPEHLCLLWKSV